MSVFKFIPIEAIRHSPFNPRRQPTSNDPLVKELAMSIEAVGLIQPISVRANGLDGNIKDHQLYQIIAGARRFEAAKLAGLEEIAAMVHEMSVDDALKLTVTENLQRQDLTPLEEGRGIASLLEAGRSTDEIAADIAKSVTWVRRRAKLVELSQDWQAKLADPRFVHFGAAHLEYIVQFTEQVQNKILDDILQRQPEDITLLRFKRIISEHLQYLVEAKFDTTECKTKCQQRSDLEPDLFADVKAYGETPDDDCRCLNAECWDKKYAQWFGDITKKLAKKTNQEPYLLADSYTATREDTTGRTLSRYVTNQVAEGTPGAVPAVFIDGEKAGQITWIENQTDGRGDPDPEKNKYARPEATLTQKRIHHQCHAFNDWLEKQKELPAALDGQHYLLSAIMIYGLYPDHTSEATRLEIFKDLITQDLHVLYQKYWSVLKQRIQLHGIADATYIDEDEENELALALEVCGLDAQDFIDAAFKAFPDEKKTKKGAKK